ncbi:nuclear transport factor 2 family protein [Actinoplanes sp. N902-109]|uniref:nuclear transport factor 2 family protein n=1 Tax=Actinoplanes sp. (strain N902-109) TaxID=649831 RepID=UPI0003294A1A|nr:nuclear transport factor 2 family protein [Actinoplanes sp. N902-109]AGL13578.1 hypothetical protein L083_0068 [Actinoplanes sp. N902-109]
MDELADRAELIELMSRYADIADLKDFNDLPRRVFTDPITLDFASVAGIPPMSLPLSDYLETLRGTFERFQATHHVISGHVVTVRGDSATIHAHVRAEHFTPGADRWLVVGFYDNEAVRTADGWRLSRVCLTASYQENAPLTAR